jgi:hypothetical protein
MWNEKYHFVGTVYKLWDTFSNLLLSLKFNLTESDATSKADHHLWTTPSTLLNIVCLLYSNPYEVRRINQFYGLLMDVKFGMLLWIDEEWTSV